MPDPYPYDDSARLVAEEIAATTRSRYRSANSA